MITPSRSGRSVADRDDRARGFERPGGRDHRRDHGTGELSPRRPTRRRTRTATAAEEEADAEVVGDLLGYLDRRVVFRSGKYFRGEDVGSGVNPAFPVGLRAYAFDAMPTQAYAISCRHLSVQPFLNMVRRIF